MAQPQRSPDVPCPTGFDRLRTSGFSNRGKPLPTPPYGQRGCLIGAAAVRVCQLPSGA